MIFYDEHLKKVNYQKGQEISWRISAYVLVTNKNKILMEMPAYNNFWELPGGSVDINENLTRAAIRECYEETGYKIKILKQEPINTGEQFFKSEAYNKFFHSILIVFEGGLVSEKQNVYIINTLHETAGVSDEISKVDWIDPKTLTKNNCHPMFYKIIKKEVK